MTGAVSRKSVAWMLQCCVASWRSAATDSPSAIRARTWRIGHLATHRLLLLPLCQRWSHPVIVTGRQSHRRFSAPGAIAAIVGGLPRALRFPGTVSSYGSSPPGGRRPAVLDAGGLWHIRRYRIFHSAASGARIARSRPRHYQSGRRHLPLARFHGPVTIRLSFVPSSCCRNLFAWMRKRSAPSPATAAACAAP